jgi:ABC-type multidrug transport system ATPase subunit
MLWLLMSMAMCHAMDTGDAYRGPNISTVPCQSEAPCTALNTPDYNTTGCPMGTIGARGPQIYHTQTGSTVQETLVCYVCWLEGTFCDGHEQSVFNAWVVAHDSANYCPGGYYCPRTYEKFQCPAGYHCRDGSSEPKSCSSLSLCPTGSTYPQQYLAYVAAAAFCGVCVLAFQLEKQNMLKATLRERVLKKYVTQFRTQLQSWLLTARHYIWVRHGRIGPSPWLQASASAEGVIANAPGGFATFGTLKPEERIHVAVKDLSMTLKSTGVNILDNVNLSFEAGQLHGVFGPSGCGKSTLLTELLGRTDVAALSVTGSVLVNGQAQSLSAARSRVGFVPQDDVLPEDLTVHQVLTFAERLRGDYTDSPVIRSIRVEEVEHMLDISFVKHSQVGASDVRGISGGQRKRASVGMELVAHPDIVLADELTSGLDATTAFQIMQTLQRLCKSTGVTVIMTIHQPRPQIFSLFDKLVFFLEGRVVFEGTPTEAPLYFEQLGFERPEGCSTPDFVLDCVSGLIPRNGFTTSFVGDLADEWQTYKHVKSTLTVDRQSTFHEIMARHRLASVRIPQNTATLRIATKKRAIPETAPRTFNPQYITVTRIQEDGSAEGVVPVQPNHAMSDKLPPTRDHAMADKLPSTSNHAMSDKLPSTSNHAMSDKVEGETAVTSKLGGLISVARHVYDSSSTRMLDRALAADLSQRGVWAAWGCTPMCRRCALIALDMLIQLPQSHWLNLVMSILAVFACLCSLTAYQQTATSSSQLVDPEESGWSLLANHNDSAAAVLILILIVESIVSLGLRLYAMLVGRVEGGIHRFWLEVLTIACHIAMVACLIAAFLASDDATAFALATTSMLRFAPWLTLFVEGKSDTHAMKVKLKVLSGRVASTKTMPSLAGQRSQKQLTVKVSPSSSSEAAAGIPDAVSRPLRSRKVPTKSTQFLGFFTRSLLQHVANTRLVLFYLFLSSVLGLMIGILFGPETGLSDVPLKLLLAEICVSLVAAASGMQLFNRELLLYYRERAGGASALAYFLAKNVAFLPIALMQPIFFLVSYVTVSAPAASFTHQFIILLALQFASSGVGMLVGIVFRRDAAIAMVAAAMVFALFNTFNPALPYFKEDLGLGPVGGLVVVGASYIRWTSEALYLAEVEGTAWLLPTRVTTHDSSSYVCARCACRVCSRTSPESGLRVGIVRVHERQHVVAFHLQYLSPWHLFPCG